MVGASGFEPPTSWSRTNQFNPITLYLGVAYGTAGLISPLLLVPNLYLFIEQHSSFYGVKRTATAQKSTVDPAKRDKRQSYSCCD